MRSKLIISAFVFSLVLLLAGGKAFTNRNGAPAGRSGGPGESTCATSSCHAGTLNSGPGLVTLTSDAPNGIYSPGITYTITAKVEQSGISRFGFEVLSGYSSATNSSVGTTSILAAGETKLLIFGQKRYVTQITGGSTGSTSRTWSFSWTAPAQGSGEIGFFMAGNAANNNGNRSGDQVYTTSLTLVEAAVGIEDAFRATKMEVFPTLATERIQVRILDAGLAPYQVEILNQQGQVVRQMEVTASGTKLQTEISLSGFAAGMYYLRVAGEQFADTQKFMKY
jgi:hypothetical protein